MGNKIIKYKNVTHEDIRFFYLTELVEKTQLIICEYMQDEKWQYIIIGKISGDSVNLTGKNLFDWIYSTRKLISNYKENINKNNFEYEKFLDLNLTKEIEFTKEGYDLINNKFIYTNYEIETTVNIDAKERNGKLYYETKWLMDNYNAINDHFYPIAMLEKNYFFTNNELSNINQKNFVRYISNNNDKIMKLFNSREELLAMYYEMKEPSLKLEFLKQMLSMVELEPVSKMFTR